MVLQQVTRRIDDLDGSELPGSATPFSFSVEGVDYEIDLSDDNVALFRSVLTPFVAAARRVDRSSDAFPRTRAAQTDMRRSIRAWARANSFEVSDRGRISDEVLAAYAAVEGSRSLSV